MLNKNHKVNYSKFSPSFCFIAPTEYIEEFGIQSDAHLVLAHLVDRDEKYASEYKLLSDNGDLIIMDNSAYELKEPFSPATLIDLGNKCGADVIVLPDYPFQHSSHTINAGKELIPAVKAAGFGTFFVPQSKSDDIEDWISAYQWAASSPDIDMIGMSILGIPNAIPWCEPAFARVVMTQILIERGVFNFDKHHHYLGLNAGPALEIPTLLRMNVLDTIDSSGPIWSAILGHEYSVNTDSYSAVKKLKMPVKFDYPMTKDRDTLKRIQHNIELTWMLFNDDNDAPTRWYAQE
jgi:hypothetical protein